MARRQFLTPLPPLPPWKRSGGVSEWAYQDMPAERFSKGFQQAHTCSNHRHIVTWRWWPNIHQDIQRAKFHSGQPMGSPLQSIPKCQVQDTLEVVNSLSVCNEIPVQAHHQRQQQGRGECYWWRREGHYRRWNWKFCQRTLHQCIRGMLAAIRV